jgi:hypothetical protein
MVVVRAAQKTDDGVHGEPRRDFAGRVSAHAVGDNDHAEFVVEEKRILVCTAYAAPIGVTECADHGCWGVPESVVTTRTGRNSTLVACQIIDSRST